MLPAYTDYIDGGGKADDVDAVMVFKHFVGEDRIAGEVTDGPTGVDLGAGDCDGAGRLADHDTRLGGSHKLYRYIIGEQNHVDICAFKCLRVTVADNHID